MSILKTLTSVCLALMLTACASALEPLLAPDVASDAAALKPGNYVLDQKHASLVFKVGHLGFSNYVGRFEIFDVTLDFDQANPELARVEAAIDMTSLNVANESFAQTLMGSNWFDVETFPQTVFRSMSIEVTGENTGVLMGELTLHGVTNPIAMDVVFNGGGYDRLRGAYVLGLSAKTTVSRAAFGVDRFPILVGDNVNLEIEAEFLKRN